jgi:hypothetical protein
MEKWSNGNAKERTWLPKFIIIFDAQNSITPLLQYRGISILRFSIHPNGLFITRGNSYRQAGTLQRVKQMGKWNSMEQRPDVVSLADEGLR